MPCAPELGCPWANKSKPYQMKGSRLIPVPSPKVTVLNKFFVVVGLFTFILCVSVCLYVISMHVCMYVCVWTCMPWAQGCQKRALDALELELQWLWATMWMPGTEPGSSTRTSSALDCRAISPAPSFVIYWDLTWIFCHLSQTRASLTRVCSAYKNHSDKEQLSPHDTSWGQRWQVTAIKIISGHKI